MAIKSTISLVGLKSSASQSKSTAKTIQSFLSSNVKRKRNLYSSIKTIKKGRQERDKRKILQAKLFAPTLISSSVGQRNLTSTTYQGLSIGDRLLGLLKYAAAGFIFSNMPTWIALGSQFFQRLQTAGRILSTYGDETLRVLSGITDVFNSAFINISSFDFLDSSSRLKNSFDSLMTSVNDIGTGITDALNAILQPFTGIPPIGSEAPDNPPSTPSTSPSQTTPPSSPSSSDSWKQLLNLIASAESPGSRGYETILGGAKINGLTRMTITEAAKKAGDRFDGKGNYAIGRYQFTTLRDQAKNYGNLNPDKDLFTPENQDKIAIGIIKKKLGLTIEKIGKDPIGAGNILAKEWAGLPVLSNYGGKRRGQSYYQGYNSNAATISADEYESSLRKISAQRSQTSPSTSSSTQTQRNIPPNAPKFDPNKKYKSGDILTNSIGSGVSFIEIGDVLGAPRRGHLHQGIDIFCPQGTYIALRLDSEVVFAGWEDPKDHNKGYGQVIDIWVPQLGVQLRFAHCSGIIVTSGKIKAGKSFARVGSTGNSSGSHIHFEYNVKKGSSSGSSGDPSSYIPYLLLTSKLNNSSQLTSQQRSTTPLLPAAPITTREHQQQQAQINSHYQEGVVAGITQERRGRKIIVIDDRSGSTTQQIITDGGDDGGFSINESALLNNFIKNKLLLDLSYV